MNFFLNIFQNFISLFINNKKISINEKSLRYIDLGIWPNVVDLIINRPKILDKNFNKSNLLDKQILKNNVAYVFETDKIPFINKIVGLLKIVINKRISIMDDEFNKFISGEEKNTIVFIDLNSSNSFHNYLCRTFNPKGVILFNYRFPEVENISIFNFLAYGIAIIYVIDDNNEVVQLDLEELKRNVFSEIKGSVLH